MNKKQTRRIIAIFMMMVLIMLVAVGCGGGPRKPTAKDAQNYVKAALDIMCTGDYDHSSVKFADIDDNGLSMMRESLEESFDEALPEDLGLSAELKQEFVDCMFKALEKARYSVGEATPTEDGGFNVAVTVEPLKMFAGITEDVLRDKMMEDIDKLSSMTEAEVIEYVFRLEVDLINENLDSPEYAAPVDLTLYYGIIDEEKNIYGCDETEGQKLGEALFSLEGMM